MGLNLLEKLSMADYIEPWPVELIDFMAPETRVIYSDVDGTLLGPGGCLFKDERSVFTGSVAQAVLQCHLNSIDVVLVSGRNRHQLFSDARILGFTNWIAELGCQIVYSRGEVVLLNVGDFPITKSSVWHEIDRCGAPKLLLETFKGRLEYHLPWSEGRECTHLLRGRIDCGAANALLAGHGHGELKVIDNGLVHRRSSALAADIREVHAYHLLPKASSKSSAVRKDRETRDIPKDLTAAIGDSIADLELANEVGVLFLVRNAVIANPELLERIKDYPNVFITHEAMGLGWAEAIDFLIGRKSH
ncbi:MAG TPA: HAD hydrolase family protein [Candidatus Aquicultor sp.]|jgi:hypothetical protein